MRDLDWGLLRSFLAVIDAGSLSAASARVAATQPTLSRHIRDLEAILGVPLFTRSAHGLEPTDAALALVDDARAMGSAAEALARKAQGRSQQLTGTVRITASVMVANLMLPPIVTAIRQAEPSIQVELVASDLTQNLLRRDADIAIRMVDPTQGALIARKLGETPLGLFGARSYFARRGWIDTIADLAHHDLIGLDRSEAVVRGFGSQGVTVTRDDFPLRTDDPMVYWNLILAGSGIGVAQILLAERCHELERVSLDIALPSLPVWLVMHEDVRTSARIRRVADILGTALRDALASP